MSVVIPTHNREQYLGRAIESALSQMEEGDELIVVDDGSTDGTPRLLESYRDRVSVVVGERGGAGAARNRGIEAARCDLVTFLDSDDEWFPGKLRMQRQLLEARPDVVCAFGEMACTFKDGSVARRHLWSWHNDPRSWDEILPNPKAFSVIADLPPEVEDFPVHVGDMFAQMAHRLYVLTSSFIARRASGAALRFEEGVSIYEDWACFGRVARLGPVAFMDTELAWQHGYAEDRVSDEGELQRSIVHLDLLESIWGVDEEYLATHRAEFTDLLELTRLEKAANLILAGNGREARATLAQMDQPPVSYRALARLPRPLVSALLALRRAVGAGWS